MSKLPGKEPSVALKVVTVEYALWTFVHTVNQVFPKKAIVDGRAFVADLNAQKPSALEQVFDYADEGLTLRKSMAARATLNDRLLFPEEPIDMLRYFLVGDWEQRLVKYPKPPASGDQCNKPAPRHKRSTHR